MTPREELLVAVAFMDEAQAANPHPSDDALADEHFIITRDLLAEAAGAHMHVKGEELWVWDWMATWMSPETVAMQPIIRMARNILALKAEVELENS